MVTGLIVMSDSFEYLLMEFRILVERHDIRQVAIPQFLGSRGWNIIREASRRWTGSRTHLHDLW